MIIEIHFKNLTPGERVDFIELTNGQKTITLDWEVSEVKTGVTVGREVYIKEDDFEERCEKEGSDSFANGTGRIQELKGFYVSGIQTYIPETDTERIGVKVLSVGIIDGDKSISIMA